MKKIVITMLMVLWFYPFLRSKAQHNSRKKPNIVLIMADDLGYSDIGAYGSEIKTPNLDKLAQQGVLFTQFYNLAKCSQSRASLLTGLHYQQTNLLKRSDNNVTLPEVLNEANYKTIMSGKWHLGEWKKREDTPLDRGFDHFFGFLGGAINFYTGEDWGTSENYMRMEGQKYEVPGDFYATDNFTDYAIKQINESIEKSFPFFLYLAYNAPHFPLQVPEEEIQKYMEAYQAGWDSIRAQRFQSMQRSGLISNSNNWELTKRDSLVPPWESLTEKQQQEEQRLMATYAGMIDRMDQQIGRLLNHLEKQGVSDNTIILFLSDNGGCAFDFNRTPDKAPGPKDALRSYNVEWANVSNMPFKKYKQWMHEGGIASPLIIRWPKKFKGKRLFRTPTHIIDIMPTILDLADIKYPTTYQGRKVLPSEGTSRVELLEGGKAAAREPLYWEFQGSRAVRLGKWKLVAERGKPWELYNLDTDRTETINVAKKHKGIVKKMGQMYKDWSERLGATPDSVARNMPLNKRAAFTFGQQQNDF